MKHIESLGRPLATIIKDVKEIPAMMGVIAQKGGTRPAWGVKNSKAEHMLLAWPQESLLRGAIIITGKPEEKLSPCSVFPFLEGISNELAVEKTHTWANGIEGEVACAIGETEELLWFYDPLYFRDKQTDLTEGVTQTFYMAGLCLAVRPALLDELTVTNGPQYEAYVAAWLQENPGKTRLDAPSLKMDLKGQRILAPTGVAGEYQARATVKKPESFNFGPENGEVKINRFVVTFGQKQFLNLMMYASEFVCQKGYEPKEGDEVDLLFWLQGRVIDADPTDMTGTIDLAGQAEQNGTAQEATEAKKTSKKKIEKAPEHVMPKGVKKS